MATTLSSATEGDALPEHYCGCWGVNQDPDYVHWFVEVDEDGIAYSFVYPWATNEEIANCRENS